MKKKVVSKSVNIKNEVNKSNQKPETKLTGNEKYKYLSYFEKLKHPKWQKKRLEIMNRDNFKCRCCLHSEKTLNVHHIFYDKKYKNPWDYPNELLVTMCEDCHAIEHELNIEIIGSCIVKELIELSNYPLSQINCISDEIEYNIKEEDYNRKEAIKMAYLKLIQGL